MEKRKLLRNEHHWAIRMAFEAMDGRGSQQTAKPYSSARQPIQNRGRGQWRKHEEGWPIRRLGEGIGFG